MPLVISKVLPMSPVHLLPMSPVYTPPCQRGTLTSDTASPERKRLVTYRKRLFHSPTTAENQKNRQSFHPFLPKRQPYIHRAFFFYCKSTLVRTPFFHTS